MDILDSNEMDEITEKIWLGNMYSSTHIINLNKHGIKKILSLIDSPPKINNDIENNIIRKIIKISDFPKKNIIKYFGDCLNFLDGEEKTLVHCKIGSSRSATIVIAYIMWKLKMKYEEAYTFVKNKRKIAEPNKGFKEQLKIFETLLIKNNYNLENIDFNNLEKFHKSPEFEW